MYKSTKGEEERGREGLLILTALPLALSNPPRFLLSPGLALKKKIILHPLSGQNWHLRTPRRRQFTQGEGCRLACLYAGYRAQVGGGASEWGVGGLASLIWAAKCPNSSRFNLPDLLSPTGELETLGVPYSSTQQLSLAVYPPSMYPIQYVFLYIHIPTYSSVSFIDIPNFPQWIRPCWQQKVFVLIVPCP